MNLWLSTIFQFNPVPHVFFLTLKKAQSGLDIWGKCSILLINGGGIVGSGGGEFLPLSMFKYCLNNVALIIWCYIIMVLKSKWLSQLAGNQSLNFSSPICEVLSSWCCVLKIIWYLNFVSFRSLTLCCLFTKIWW